MLVCVVCVAGVAHPTAAVWGHTVATVSTTLLPPHTPPPPLPDPPPPRAEHPVEHAVQTLTATAPAGERVRQTELLPLPGALAAIPAAAALRLFACRGAHTLALALALALTPPTPPTPPTPSTPPKEAALPTVRMREARGEEWARTASK